MSIDPRWYYADGENTIGPFDQSALAKMARAKILGVDTQIIPEGGDTWTRFGDSPLRDLLFMEADPSPAPPARPGKAEKSMLANVQGFVCGFVGLPPLEDFKPSYLVVETFKRRSRSDVDTYFNCGCSRSTPILAEVSPEWPRPWFFLRFLLFGLLVLLGFCFALEEFHNILMLPGLMIVGAFFVPLACVVLFFELNVLRNISLYQVVKFIVAGGILSMILALFLFSTTRLDSFMGAMSAGIVEETAKTLTAVFFLRRVTQYGWILNGLLVGGAVGAGFAGFESAGYMFGTLFTSVGDGDGLTAFYSTMAQRAVLSPFGHVVWTASIVAALWRTKGSGPFRFELLRHWSFLRVLLFVMVLHMLWNSGLLWELPRNLALFRGKIYLMLVSFVGSWYLLFLLVQEGLQQLKAAQTTARPVPFEVADQ